MSETTVNPVDPTTTAALVADERARSAERARRADSRRRLMQNAGVVIPFLLVLVAGLAVVPNFASSSNVTNMLVNAAILAIVGYGMTLVIAVRGIDLSVGSAQALAACIAAAAVNSAGPLVGAIVGVAVGAGLGLVNGLLVTQLRVPGFVATLSTMSVFRGLVLLFTGGAPIMIASGGFKSVATSSVLGIPMPFLVAALLGVGMWFVLDRMRFGKHVVAVGGSPEAAVDTGISVNRVLLTAYLVAGASAGIGGVLLASQLGVVNGSIASGLELQAIAIVVLGGTSMAGGRPRIVGTFIAALLLTMINSGLNLLNVPSFYQYVALGALLVFALSIDGAQRAAVRRMLEGRLS
ncbi:ABC transporter permease [Cellulomonas chengniuliangii]|uniref:ABC transporter permease n=1 Tax=Cellulomonas chengniuliangii TaxID=2968084 RepID=A0ABY5L504_9CELL|nr:ABC transporter permease [Cellulomonas chengniuliangii]MCC2307546.1 ABC transporter permease [Cellulomonas chengniuliangii]MCC2318658.1 ABC transporter permease [Cellulomonas chengniuliangii]UUI75683.1 ABC transporter permease [Cellulomonas chengniuliangii]